MTECTTLSTTNPSAHRAAHWQWKVILLIKLDCYTHYTSAHSLPVFNRNIFNEPPRSSSWYSASTSGCYKLHLKASFFFWYHSGLHVHPPLLPLCLHLKEIRWLSAVLLPSVGSEWNHTNHSPSEPTWVNMKPIFSCSNKKCLRLEDGG